MADAYEIFIGPQLKGESGQFFTPRTVIRMAVDMLRPSIVKQERVIDPACGSGGFLVQSLRYVRGEAEREYPNVLTHDIDRRIREYARDFFVGIDIEPLLHKVSRSFMAIVGNGRSGIAQADSLAVPDSWSSEVRDKLRLGTFDVLLTNPPFGTRIKVHSTESLRQFDLGHALNEGAPTQRILPSGQDPAILFLERCWQLLRPGTGNVAGGRMVIVLPRQITSGHHRDMWEIRKWMLGHMRILAVVDLPRETFQPYTGTLTSILFAERTEHSESGNPNSEVFMAVPQSVGHDRRGNPKIRRTAEGESLYNDQNNPILENDLPEVALKYRQFCEGFDLSTDNTATSVFSVSLSGILSQSRNRLDASFYDPNKNDVVKRIWDMDDPDHETVTVKTVGDICKDVFYPGRHRRNYVTPNSVDAVPFLSGSNILQVRPFDVKWQPRSYRPMTHHMIESGWILVTRSGTTGRVLYVGDEIAGFPVNQGVAVSEHVIRIVPDAGEVDPGYLFAFLSTDDIGRTLLAQGIYASVVEHITPQHVKDIPIPLPPRTVQKTIGDQVRAAEAQRLSVNQAIRTAQTVIGNAVSGEGFPSP